MDYQDERAAKIFLEIWQALPNQTKSLELNNISLTTRAGHLLISLGLPQEPEQVDYQLERFGEVRSRMWHKQITENISGLKWSKTHFCGQTINLPVLERELIAITGDKEIMQSCYAPGLNWVGEFTKVFPIWRISEKAHKISWGQFIKYADNAEWIELEASDKIVNVYEEETGEEYEAPLLSLHVGLGWGILGHHIYKDAYPESGIMRFQITNKPVLG